MTEALVLLTVQAGVATLSFNDAPRLNPLSDGLLDDSLRALQRVRDDRSIRALVLTAHGRGFCVGADLTALATGTASADAPGGLGQTVGHMMEQRGNPLVLALRELPVPVLCAVNGVAAGGGVGIALAADIVIAARSAYFYLPFVPALGLVPDMGCVWFMQRSLGHARTLALSLLGDKLSAEQAAQWGLIWACVDDARLHDEAQALATRLAGLPADAIVEARALMQHAQTHPLIAQLGYEATRQRELIEGEAFAEGLRAFGQKRRPVFAGR